MDVQIIATIISAAVTIGTVVVLDRKKSRAEGAKAQQFDDMRRTVARHDKEIIALREKCLSWDDHEVEATRCRAVILEKVEGVSTRQDEMDESRDKAREEDSRWKEQDSRWKMSILLYLGKIASKLDIPPINHHEIGA